MSTKKCIKGKLSTTQHSCHSKHNYPHRLLLSAQNGYRSRQIQSKNTDLVSVGLGFAEPHQLFQHASGAEGVWHLRLA